MKNSPLNLKRLKTLALSIVFFLAYQVSFAQSSAEKKPLELPANPSSVKPVERKVNIIKNSETVVSTDAENNATTKHYDGGSKTVYSNPAGPGVGEKVYISTENETNQAKAVPSAVSVPIVEDTKQPK